MFVSVFLGVGAIALLGGLVGLACWMLDTPIPVLGLQTQPGPAAFFLAFGIFFGGGGLAMLFSVGSPTFDRTAGMFWKKRKPGVPGTVDPDSCRLGEIHALQLLSEYVPASTTGKNRMPAYYSHELNLVLKDGRRINVVDHGEPALLRQNATRLAQFLGCKLWDALGEAALAAGPTAPPVTRRGIASAAAFVAIIGVAMYFIATPGPREEPAEPAATPAPPPARASVKHQPAIPDALSDTPVAPLPAVRMEYVSLQEGNVMSLLVISGTGFGHRDNHRVALSGKDFVLYPEVESWSRDFISLMKPSDPRLIKGETYQLSIERISPPGSTEPVSFRYEALGVSQSVLPDRAVWAPPPATGTPAIRITAADPPAATFGKPVTLTGTNFGPPEGLQILAESATNRIELEAVEWSDTRIVARFPAQRQGQVDPGTAFYYLLVGPTSSSNALPFDLAPMCGMMMKKFAARCERALAGRDECATQSTLKGMTRCLATTPDPELLAQCARMPSDRQRAACEAQFRAEQICKGETGADAFFACFDKNMPADLRDVPLPVGPS